MADDSDAMRIAVAFARVLRGVGVVVPIGCVLSFAEGIEAVGFAERSPVYWVGRTTLVHRRSPLMFLKASSTWVS